MKTSELKAIQQRGLIRGHLLGCFATLAMTMILISSVCADVHRPEDFLKSIEGKPEAGREIVKHYCAVCHAEHPQIEVGAPKMHRSKDWEARLKQGAKRLFEHTDAGMGAMPPRGGCFECSDAALGAAIDALIKPSSP